MNMTASVATLTRDLRMNLISPYCVVCQCFLGLVPNLLADSQAGFQKSISHRH